MLGMREGQGHSPAGGRVGVHDRVTEEDHAGHDGSSVVDQAPVAVVDAGHDANVGDWLSGCEPRRGQPDGALKSGKAFAGRQLSAQRVDGGHDGEQREASPVARKGHGGRPPEIGEDGNVRAGIIGSWVEAIVPAEVDKATLLSDLW
jgi:hypothetical protein